MRKGDGVDRQRKKVIGSFTNEEGEELAYTFIHSLSVIHMASGVIFDHGIIHCFTLVLYLQFIHTHDTYIHTYNTVGELHNGGQR